MSVTVLSSPTTPNATGTKLVYSVSSSLALQPQFQYVTDIYESGSTNLLTRLLTYPNFTGNGVVEIGKVLDDNLEYDKYWKVTGSITPDQSVKKFDIRFGEAYAPSISGSVTIYTGSTSNIIEVCPAIVDPNEGSFNFNTSSFYNPGAFYLGNPYLTNNPAAQTDDSVSNDNYAVILNSSDYFTLTPFIDQYFTANRITLFGYKIENGTRSISAVTSSFFYIPSNDRYFNTIGIGPGNLSDWDSGWNDYFVSGTINLLSTAGDAGGVNIIINDLWDGSIAQNVTNPFPQLEIKPCNSEYTRFAFINMYGFWDYYNVYNPLRRVTEVDRNIYESPYVNYSSEISRYNITDRGNTQYRTNYTDTYQITTDYIDKAYSDWLQELFDSPDVYIQQGSNFIPINITNTTVEWNMNQSRQKLFQYTIDFKYSNKRPER